MKSKQEKRPRSVDGFVPRRLGDQPGTGGKKRRTLNDFRSTRSTEAIEFRDTWSKDENTLSIEPTELDAADLSTPPEKKKRFKFFRRKKDRKKWHEMTRKEKIKRVALIVGILLLCIGAFLGWKFILNAHKIFNGNILGIFDNTKLRGEDEGRVNILLAGTSEDDPGHQGADLTDSIMVASIDVRNNTAFTTSIPRDLWVEYGQACSSGYAGKINVAYQCGQDVKFKEAGYPEGGMGLLSKIVSEKLGLKLHYYGKINYTAFKQAVDAVGGIEVTIKSDDPRGVYDPNIAPVDGGPLNLKNGTQKIDGRTALALARSRNSAGGYGMARGDFDRTTYQQQMLVALKNKALSTGTLINPAKIGGLLDSAGKNVKTDFKTNELRRLYELGKQIQSDKITTIDMASEEINLLTTGMYSGQSIVHPVAGFSDFSDIQRYFRKLTSTNAVVREDASVAVLNGSGVIGLAQKKADELGLKNIDVVAVGNAAQRKTTVIIDKTNGKKPATIKLLEQIFGVTASKNTSSYPDAANYESDIVIIIGTSGSSSTSSNNE